MLLLYLSNLISRPIRRAVVHANHLKLVFGQALSINAIQAVGDVSLNVVAGKDEREFFHTKTSKIKTARFDFLTHPKTPAYNMSSYSPQV